MKKQFLFLTILLIGISLTGQGQTTVAMKPGIWRAVLKTPGGDLPFGLLIWPNSDKATYQAYAFNGLEQLPMDAATIEGDSVHIPMALFESELVAKIDDKLLKGYWRRRRGGEQYQTMPFEARMSQLHRFEPKTAAVITSPPINVTGKWTVKFQSGDGSDGYEAVGVFAQKGNRVTGTFLTTTGDYRYLEGNVFGDSLFLSCFDGSHAFLFKAKVGSDKKMEGTFNSGFTGLETWTASLNPAAALPDEKSLTFLKPGEKTLAFSFPEPNGQPVSLSDDRFKDKVTIVQILGSWCPNCMDETNFLSPWYKKNKNRGVEVVGLAFERTANMAESGPKIERMKLRFKIDYPVVLAGTNNKAEASKALPALNRVVAFPTTIFIDKKGVIREIHTGFSGPGTGPYYDKFVAEFNRLVDKLVAEE
ncbi:MAG: TlpA family protein disulfide reductase [Bacteroidetes bacterium]|nr:TlpA family protein disulfide reductase [Fibrella sp.]